MGLETVNFLNDLVATNPVNTDPKSQGDDHIRNIKTGLLATFPFLAGRTWRFQTKSAPYTIATTDNMSVLYNTVPVAYAYPAVATLGNGHMLVIANRATTAGTVITPNGVETINNAGSYVVAPGSAVVVLCSGAALFAFPLLDVLDEDNMASDSAVLPPSQQSVKAYVDAAVAPLTSAVGTLVVKQADESVTNSVTLQDDNDLTVAVAANTEYLIEYTAILSIGALAHGFKIAATWPASPTGALHSAIAPLDPTESAMVASNATPTSGAVVLNKSAWSVLSTPYIIVKGQIWLDNGANAGNVVVQWAQGTSNANALIMKAGSNIKSVIVS